MSWLKTSIINGQKSIFLGSLLVVIIVRLLIYIWLNSHGYFYGIPWDSFSRTLLSYDWAQHPFFAPSDGYWLPLQFWLVGSLYFLIQHWDPTSNILVPVVVNNIFFLGSIVIIYQFCLKITGRVTVGLLAALLAVIFAGDVFVTYSALSEPILIFLILLAGYQFYSFYNNGIRRPRLQFILFGFTGLFAAATHYIGWFLSGFLVLSLFPFIYRSIFKREISKLAFSTLGVILCIIMPTLWLLNNYLTWGNPLHPIQFARQMQADYIGQMSFFTRFLVTPKVIIKQFYPVIIPGFLATLFLLIKKPKILLFMTPAVFVLAMIWLSTWFALSAPYQEPRYLVFICWAAIPVIAITLDYLFNFKKQWLTVLLILILIFMGLLNLRQISSFKNSFNNDVKSVAYLTKDWFTGHPDTGKVFIVQDSFAETGVIPVISGYPNRIIILNIGDIKTAYSDPAAFFNQRSKVWMCVVKDKTLAADARQEGLKVDQIGIYFMIQP